MKMNQKAMKRKIQSATWLLPRFPVAVTPPQQHLVEHQSLLMVLLKPAIVYLNFIEELLSFVLCIHAAVNDFGDVTKKSSNTQDDMDSLTSSTSNCLETTIEYNGSARERPLMTRVFMFLMFARLLKDKRRKCSRSIVSKFWTRRRLASFTVMITKRLMSLRNPLTNVTCGFWEFEN